MSHAISPPSRFASSSTPRSALTSMPHLSPLSTPHPVPSSPLHLASLSMPHLTQSSTAHHESSTHLVHSNQPSIPSPRLEKSREGLVREGEFLANQAHLSVQASPKYKKNKNKTPILRSGLLCPDILYSFFLYRQSMWFLLILVVTPAYNHPSLCKPCTLLASLYFPTE